MKYNIAGLPAATPRLAQVDRHDAFRCSTPSSVTRGKCTTCVPASAYRTPRLCAVLIRLSPLRLRRERVRLYQEAWGSVLFPAFLVVSAFALPLTMRFPPSSPPPPHRRFCRTISAVVPERVFKLVVDSWPEQTLRLVAWRWTCRGSSSG